MSLRALVLVWCAPSIALAQVGVFFPGEDECITVRPDCMSTADCEGAFDSPSTCEPVEIENVEPFNACIPDRAGFCCSADEALRCPRGSVCHLATAEQPGICLRADLDYCDDDPAADRIEQCHTSPAGEFPIAYVFGDCDGDGVSNGDERDAGTAVCTAPPDRLAVWVDNGSDIECRTDVRPCSPEGSLCQDTSFGGVCQHDERTGDDAPLCAPAADVFCCGGDNDAECPALTCVFASDRPDAPGVCTNERFLCADDEATMRACHTSVGGAIPVPIEIGDCDDDNIANAADEDPCVPRAQGDAGPPRPPAVIEPQFNGGGGCVCRASGPTRGSVVWLSMLALLVARRRAR
jgi:hypothetical protein